MYEIALSLTYSRPIYILPLKTHRRFGDIVEKYERYIDRVGSTNVQSIIFIKMRIAQRNRVVYVYQLESVWSCFGRGPQTRCSTFKKVG